jgi:ubiquinone biosynthesis protein UbiJ
MIAPAIANHLLAREAWARERLAVHTGRSFEIAVGPFTASLAIDAAGMLETSQQRAPDVTLRVSPLDLPSFLADPARWNAYVASEGNAELVATLADIAQTLPWFVERSFAAALGPIAGQRLADAGRAMLHFPSHAASRVADSVASYASDEASVAVRRVELALFADQVADLAARADAIAARLGALAAR